MSMDLEKLKSSATSLLLRTPCLSGFSDPAIYRCGDHDVCGKASAFLQRSAVENISMNFRLVPQTSLLGTCSIIPPALPAGDDWNPQMPACMRAALNLGDETSDDRSEERD
jgi:hypothetical protein